MGEKPKRKGEKPRSEPEIISPGDAGQQSERMRIFVDTHGTDRIYVAKLGPLGFILVILVTAILSAMMLVLLLGAFIIWLPLVMLFIATVIVASVLRRYFQRAP